MTSPTDRSPMNPARWARVEALCEAALERDPAARSAFLDHECGSDRELRAEVESLLQQLDGHPSFLERPIVSFSPFAPPDDEEAPPIAGTVGPYELIRLLGRGGMGEVYLAHRNVEDIRQTVALKVIRRGHDTDEVLRRFRLERRILASLQHPNIARLLDAAATDDGRPYFVMEHIEGVSITEYCDARRLGIRERLALFQVVCGAVQYAHQHLIVHRDLKPKNILVTGDGVPKLLDFGIGKVLAPTEALGSAAETSAEVRVLTPEYAAPEQVSGGTVTTATDVYGLGVLLYELLTGRHPYLSGDESRQDVQRAVLEATPAPPGAAAGRLQRRLSGDLDRIVLKALRKEPARRYASAVALADDIQRHLDGLPVSARPDTFGYRAGRFVRRHRSAVAAVVTAFAALVVTTAVTLVQSRRVARESERVALERDKAEEVRGFLMEMFGASSADRAVGDSVTARRLLDLQAAQLDRAYGDRPALKAEMMEVLADGYDRLGLPKDAEPFARGALALRRQVLGERHPDVGSSLNLVGWIVHENGRSKDAEPLLRDAASLRRNAGPRYREGLSRSLNDLGVVYNALNRYAEAESVLTEALGIRRATFGDDHRATGITASNLAAALYFQTKVDSAVTVQRLALAALQKAVGPDHQRTVVALGNLAAFKRALGDLAAAESTYRKLLARQTRLQGRDHPVTARVVVSLASVVFNRGVAERSDTALAEAESLYRDALRSLEARLGPTHAEVGTTLGQLSNVVAQRGGDRLPAAEEMARRSLQIVRAAYGDSNANTATAVARLAQARRRSNDLPGAVRLQREAVEIRERASGVSNPETGREYATLCELLLIPGEGDGARDAVAACGTAERVLRDAPRHRRTLALARLRLAQAHLTLGRASIADSILATVRTSFGTDSAGPAAQRLLDSLTAQLAARPR